MEPMPRRLQAGWVGRGISAAGGWRAATALRMEAASIRLRSRRTRYRISSMPQDQAFAIDNGAAGLEEFPEFRAVVGAV